MSIIERPGSDCILPSQGKPYGDLLPNGLITVYSMKTTEEKLFGGLSKKSDFENVIDTLISRCTSIPKDLKPSDLYTGDRVFLMMQIRAMSYGKDYGFRASCPECGTKWDHSVDLLTGLEIRELDDDWEDPFEIVLPHSGDIVNMRLFRGYHERRIIDYVDRQSRKVNIRTAGDPGYIYRLALHIVCVQSKDPKRTFGDKSSNEAETIAQAIQYVGGLDGPDSSAMREEIDARTPGLLLSVDINCPKCGSENNTPLPVTADFFRASSRPKAHTRTRNVPDAAW